MRMWHIVVVAMLAWMLAISAKAATIQRVADKVIVLEGQIVEGDVEKLGLILEEGDLIVLNSPGGQVHVGLNMFVLINDTKAYTIVAEEGVCASMCSYVWLAGIHRRIEMGGSLGVHQMDTSYPEEANSDGLEYKRTSVNLLGIMIGLARERNAEIDAYYWAEWMTTAPDEMTWLSRNLIERLER